MGDAAPEGARLVAGAFALYSLVLSAKPRDREHPYGHGKVEFISAGIEGGLVQMISHGFVSAALFLCVGVMYDRMHTRMISDYGGVVNTMPKFAALMMLFAMANAGLPATSGFVGEFMVILGAVQFNFVTGILAATALILGAAYSLWMAKRVIFGKVTNHHVAELTDINGREFFMLGAVLAWFFSTLVSGHPAVGFLLALVEAGGLLPQLQRRFRKEPPP